MGPSRSAGSIPFAAAGGAAQQRYERVRVYALTPANERPRVSPAQFDLRRFQRLGLLGLVDRPPLRWRSGADDFEVHVIPIGAEDAVGRLARLDELLAGLVTTPQGGEDATVRVDDSAFPDLVGSFLLQYPQVGHSARIVRHHQAGAVNLVAAVLFGAVQSRVGAA